MLINTKEFIKSCLADIKQHYDDALIAKCSERNCKLRLDGLENYLILKGERICQDQKICDCIIFKANDHFIVGIIELKSRVSHANEIIRKLENTSDIALEILENVGCHRINYQLFHLVLSKRWPPPEYRVITQRKIIVRGKQYRIIPKRCGKSFAVIMRRFK